MQSVTSNIVAKIHGHGSGWVFTAKDFLDLGHRHTIDTALHRLARSGMIRRIFRGMYDYPRFSKILNKQVKPDIDQVALAFARKHGWRIQATGAMAANLLGLSTQVPAKVVYLIDGPGKSMRIGNITIQFRKAAPKDLNAENRKSALVIQALKFLGKKSVDEHILSRIRNRMSDADRKRLLRDARFGTDWIFEAVKKICETGD